MTGKGEPWHTKEEVNVLAGQTYSGNELFVKSQDSMPITVCPLQYAHYSMPITVCPLQYAHYSMPIIVA